MTDYLTPDTIKAITDAVLRDLVTGNTWEEIKDRTLADLCSANQDSLIDDLFENDPRDVSFRLGMIDHVRTYDLLLSSQRINEVPCEYQPVKGDPAIRACVVHASGLGLYGGESCEQDKSRA